MDTARTIVLPGDVVDPSALPVPQKKKALRLGPGLRPAPSGSIVSAIAGQLVVDPRRNLAYVECKGGRYTPTANDLVVGQVQRSAADVYLVGLSPHTPPALLPQLAFEHATKKTRPSLAAGALVYARVAAASRHMDPELECVSASTGRADGLGPLVGGTVVDVSLATARRLLWGGNSSGGSSAGGSGAGAGATTAYDRLLASDDRVGVLNMLAAEGLAFETAVGRNGRVWINAEGVATVVVVARALRETDERGLGVEEQRKLVKRLLREMR